jgi:hypothetical protein
MSNASRPTKTDLTEWLAHHLNYEIEMLNYTLRLEHALERSNLLNAVIESCSIHIRLLIEFFRKEQNNPRFTSGYSAFSGVDLGNIVERLNVQVAHLTFDGRTAKDEEKLTTTDRVRAAQLIGNEIAAFRRCLLSDFASVRIHDIDKPASIYDLSNVPLATLGTTASLKANPLTVDVQVNTVSPVKGQ